MKIFFSCCFFPVEVTWRYFM